MLLRAYQHVFRFSIIGNSLLLSEGLKINFSYLCCFFSTLFLICWTWQNFLQNATCMLQVPYLVVRILALLWFLKSLKSRLPSCPAKSQPKIHYEFIWPIYIFFNKKAKSGGNRLFSVFSFKANAQCISPRNYNYKRDVFLCFSASKHQLWSKSHPADSSYSFLIFRQPVQFMSPSLCF